MKKDKLILKNEFEIEMESGASLSDIRVSFLDKKAMIDAWDEMTKENLSDVSIRNGDGLTIARYENLTFESETSTQQSDGSIMTSFCLHEKTEIEKRIDKLEEGQKEAAIDEYTMQLIEEGII